MEMFLISTQNIRFGKKLVSINNCSSIAIFIAEVCFVCSKEASRRDVSFEHTEQAFWWEIMNVIVNTKNMFWVLRWVSR